jgi:exoribonuclease R
VPRRHLALTVGDGAALQAGFDQVRTELQVPGDFPADVVAEAEAAAAAPRMPDVDLTDVPFATLDPPGSRDLDQAYAIERVPASGGYRVRYAIADVAAFVTAGGALDAEAQRRVETLYAPDRRTPLYPPVLSEGAASLLPDQTRPALVWTLELDRDGEITATDVRRAVVRSREQQDYPTVQGQLDAGSAPEPVALLKEVGLLRLQRQHDRGGMSLAVPTQDVVPSDGGWRLEFRATLPAEDWNAQLSLLTGIAAARLMLDGRVGVLRTMPPADPHDVMRLRRVARALGIDWAADESYGSVLDRLAGASAADQSAADHDRVEAFETEAASLFRGAAYTAFDGTVPAETTHAAIAAPYAHCTAPLRRLVDRYAGEVCVALCAGAEVPTWARTALPGLPEVMARGDHRAHAFDRAMVDVVEAVVLAPSVGETFDAVVVDIDQRHGGGTVQLASPAVLARCEATHGPLPLGEPLRVRLLEADVARRVVRFVPA